MNNSKSVAIASIIIDERFQTRVAMDAVAIADYIAAILETGGWPFPPVKLVSHFLIDGFHRVAAAKRIIADPETPAEVRKTLQDVPCEHIIVDSKIDNIADLALLHALAANHNHGLRRSIADKKRSVKLAVDRWPDKSDREIATLTGTSHPYVGKMRRELRMETLPLESQPGQYDPRKRANLPPSESLRPAIESLKVGEGLVTLHYDLDGEHCGMTLVALLNPDDPLKRFQISDWNPDCIAFSQWGCVNRLMWVLNRLRPGIEATDFEFMKDARPLMDNLRDLWSGASKQEWELKLTAALKQ